ncbi:MAG: hypothetical protein AMS15_02990 [Planctomycetes bacterium DG_23]|nr:MAG: hypothetical protein AMS15_02990 [Planctomycetes bacterium DG_23]
MDFGLMTSFHLVVGVVPDPDSLKGWLGDEPAYGPYGSSAAGHLPTSGDFFCHSASPATRIFIRENSHFSLDRIFSGDKMGLTI